MSIENPLEEAKEALRPFAECCDQIRNEEDDEEWAKFRLLVKHYRAARQAFASLEKVRGTERLGEALYALSARLLLTGWLENAANHEAYEKVVAAFEGPFIAPDAMLTARQKGTPDE